VSYLDRLKEVAVRGLTEGRLSPRTGLTGKSPVSVLLLLTSLASAPEEFSVDIAAKGILSKFKVSKKMRTLVNKKAEKERDDQAALRTAAMGMGGMGAYPPPEDQEQ